MSYPNKLDFSLAAYDPRLSDVTLAFDEGNCVVQETSGANISVEQYLTTEAGTPREIHLRVVPDPLAFVIKFVDGKMVLEFVGSWATFKLTIPEICHRCLKQDMVTAPPVPAPPVPAPPVPAGPAFSEYCFKVIFVGEDVDAHDIRLLWDYGKFETPPGAGYMVVYQASSERGREFVLAYPHPISGELFCIRGLVKDVILTILNTDKVNNEHVPLYLDRVTDPALKAKIQAEIAAGPDWTVMILYKYGIFADPAEYNFFLTYVIHLDKDKNPLPNKDNDKDEHVIKAKEVEKKADNAGKKAAGKPQDDRDWSYGRSIIAIQPAPAPAPAPVAAPVPAEPAVGEAALMEFCFKVNFVEEDVEALDVRLLWDYQEVSTPKDAKYKVVYQADVEKGREFVITYPHPVTAELFCVRGLVKHDRLTFLNTNKFEREHVELYVTFYIKDTDLRARLISLIEAEPDTDNAVMLLYKNHSFAEAVDFISFITYARQEDKNRKTLPSNDKDDDDHVRKIREAKKKADEAGKKATEPPSDGKEWSCGRVKWELPKEERRFRDVGKLHIPSFEAKEEGPHTVDVGKLKWGGFDQEEPKEEVKTEKPVVGKLKFGGFCNDEPKDAKPKKKGKR